MFLYHVAEDGVFKLKKCNIPDVRDDREKAVCDYLKSIKVKSMYVNYYWDGQHYFYEYDDTKSKICITQYELSPDGRIKVNGNINK